MTDAPPPPLRKAGAALRDFIRAAPVALAMFDRELSLITASGPMTTILGSAEPGSDLDGQFPNGPPALLDAARRGLLGETLFGEMTRPGASDGGASQLRWRIWPWRDAAGAGAGIILYATELANDALTAAIFRLLSRDSRDLDHYLRDCVQGLARLLAVDWVHLAVPCPDAPGAMHTRAICLDGEILPNIRYVLDGTPCDVTLRDTACFFPAGARHLFPGDQVLTDLGIEAYAGVQLLRPDGSFLGILSAMHRRPLADDAPLEVGLMLASIGIGAAIERHQAEHAVRDSEQLTRAVLDAMDAQIAVLDQSGYIVLVNDAWSALSGATGVLAGMGGVGDDYASLCDAAASECTEAAEAAHRLRDVLGNGTQHAGFEFACSASRESRWFRCTIRRFEISGATHVLIKFQETTAIRRAERRSDQIHQQFSHLFDFAPDAMFMVDHSGLIRVANGRAEAMFGYAAHDLEGQPVEILINASGRGRHVALREDFTRSDRQTAMGDRRSTLRGQRRNGEEFPVEISLSRYSGPDDEYMIASVRDISAREQAQADRLARQVAEEANEAKSTFLATMSHEIRTPLSAVLGLAEVLTHTTLSHDQAQLLDNMRGSAQHLLRLIDDVLDFSKIEAGSLEIERAPLDLVALIEHTARGLATHAADRGVELQLYVAPEVPRQVLSDEVRLRQIIFNLLGNAIKFSVAGQARGGIAALRAEMEPGEAKALRLEFIDNGIGMHPQDSARIFQPFTQAEQSTTRKFGGTGLGLAICRRIVDRLGGKIAVTSAPGHGSTFVVRLPLEPLPQDAASDRTRDAPVLKGILCVMGASHSYAAADMRRVLEQRGARVIDPAETGDALPQHGAGVVLIRGEGDEPAPGPLVRLPQVIVGHDTGHRLAIRGRGRVFVEGRAMSAGDLTTAIMLAADEAESGIAARGVRSAIPVVPVADGTAPPILVAEDDPINRKVILRQLDLLGVRADLAHDGADAHCRWRKGDYRLLLTDLHMPQMDGYALTRAIRADEASDPARRRVRIVALTANALRDELSRARAAGLDGFLTKPISLERLAEELSAWLPHDDTPVSAPCRTSLPASMPDAPPPHNDVIDTSTHPTMIGDDIETVRGFLGAYRDQSIALAGQIARAAGGGDMAQAAMLLHRLKSSSRWVGARAFGDMCERLEALAQAGDSLGLNAGLSDFAGRHTEVLVALAELGATTGEAPIAHQGAD